MLREAHLTGCLGQISVSVGEMQWHPRTFLGSGAGVKDQSNPWRNVGSLRCTDVLICITQTEDFQN